MSFTIFFLLNIMTLILDDMSLYKKGVDKNINLNKKNNNNVLRRRGKK